MSFSKSVAWYTAEKIFRLGTGLFVSGYTARVLGNELFGEFNYYLTLVSILSFIATFSLELISVKEFSDKNTVDNKKITNLITLRIFTACLYMLSIVLLLFFIDVKNTYVVLILALGSAFGFSSIYESYFLSRAEGKYITKVRTFVFLLISMAKIIGLTYVKNSNILIMLSIVQLFEVIFILSLYISKLGFVNHNLIDIKYIKNIISQSIPLVISSTVIILYNKIDQLMISSMLGFIELGKYSVAIRLSESLNIMVMAIVTGYIPTIIRDINDTSKFAFKYQKLAEFLNYTCIVILFGFILVGREFITIVFGESYIDSFYPTCILIFSTVFSCLTVISSHWLVAEKMGYVRLKRSIISLGINLLLNFLLIPIIGIEGAAISTLISQIYSSLLGYTLNMNTRKIVILNMKSLLPINMLLGVKNRWEALK
ncbi:oligosaccharide flippase family protein [Vibrio fluvialis]|uniref:oligosaccharide flippase family protein n=1 Tax=Vibrio fluvialis TaxID=676 RepID=UPI0028F6E682|nr:oligosaccharide flippase family protein [Vibrio fluvialis]